MVSKARKRPEADRRVIRPQPKEKPDGQARTGRRVVRDDLRPRNGPIAPFFLGEMSGIFASLDGGPHVQQ